MFNGFSPPKNRIILHNSGYSVEIWPEVAGGIARFDKALNDGKTISLFSPAKDYPGYSAPDLGCFPLLPYSNRIAGGELAFNGKSYSLEKNMEGWDNTLHGLGWQRAWQEITHDKRSAVLRLDHKPDKDWPFAFSAEQSFVLGRNGLTITTSITNTDTRTAPYGLGQHPRFPRPAGTTLHADVKGVWLADEKVMPTIHTDLPSQWNLPKGCVLDGVKMDHCFTGLQGSVKISWPGSGSITMKGSDNLRFLVAYNPLHENFVCVEPVTHMTDAINRAAKGHSIEETGFTAFKPGETVRTIHRFAYQPS